MAVDAVGCPQKGSITLEGVTFDYNSATADGELIGCAGERGIGSEEIPEAEGGAAGSHRQQGSRRLQPHALTENVRMRFANIC